MSESTWNPFLQLVRPSQWKIKKQSRLLLGRYRRIETEWWPNQSAKESTIFAPPPLIVTGSSFSLKRTQPTKSLAAFQEWKKKISVKTNLSFFFSLLVYLKDFHVLFFFILFFYPASLSSCSCLIRRLCNDGFFSRVNVWFYFTFQLCCTPHFLSVRVIFRH